VSGSGGSSTSRPALAAFWAVLRSDRPRLPYAFEDRMHHKAQDAYAALDRARESLPWFNWDVYTCAGWVEAGPEKDPRKPMSVVDACTELRTYDKHSAKPSAPRTMRERLARFCCPNDGVQEAMDYLADVHPVHGPTSNCELFALGFARLLNVKSWRLDSPYIPERMGRAGEDLRAVGLEAKLWEERPEHLGDARAPGDIIMVRGPGPEHASCVVDYEASSGTFVCCDGGQGDGRDIAIVRRKIIVPNGVAWLVDADLPYGADEKTPKGRRIVGVLMGSTLE
jgi:hypothetical protein